MPFAGYRYYNNAVVISVGSDGDYWSSTPDLADNAYSLYFYSSSIYPQYDYYRAYGFAVRCFKNEPSLDIVLEATSTEANQTLKINKYFASPYTVDR